MSGNIPVPQSDSVDIIMSAYRQYIDRDVQFWVNRTNPSISFYHWDFGDGDSSTAAKPYHQYRKVGNYDIHLRYTDSTGVHDIVKKEFITIIPPTIVDFDVDVRSGAPPLLVQFINKSSGSIMWYKWTFDDSSKVTSVMHTPPPFEYTLPNVYSPSLTVYDGIAEYTLRKYHHINVGMYSTYFFTATKEHFERGTGTLIQHKFVNKRSHSYKRIFTLANNKTYVYLHTSQTSTGDPYYSSCGHENRLILLNQRGEPDKTILYSDNPSSTIENKYLDYCEYPYVVAPVGNKRLAIGEYNSFYKNGSYLYSGDTLRIINEDGKLLPLSLPSFSTPFSIHELKTGLLSVAVYPQFAQSHNNTKLCFYVQDSLLLAKDSISGYALPALDIASGESMSIVSPSDSATAQDKWIQLRYYTAKGVYQRSIIIQTISTERIIQAEPIGEDRYLLMGFAKKRSNQSIIYFLRIIDAEGRTITQFGVPGWRYLIKMKRIDDNTIGVLGQTENYNYAVVALRDSKILGEYVFEPHSFSAEDFAFGSDASTLYLVGYRSSDSSYAGTDAVFYQCQNIPIKDIGISDVGDHNLFIIKEEEPLVYPIPTQGIINIRLPSTLASQTVDLHFSTLLGESITHIKTVVPSDAIVRDIELKDLIPGCIVMQAYSGAYHATVPILIGTP